MTPGARITTAIEILDLWRGGQSVEQALTRWARSSRFAGSKDRAAIRDHVYDALRRWRSATTRGGAETGRGAMLGLLREGGTDPDTVFNGEGHAPPPLSAAERGAGREPDDRSALDLPDWLWPQWQDSLGARAEACASALRNRAPVFLRVNTLKTDRDAARRALAEDGIETILHDLVPTALEVTSGARGVAGSTAFRTGLVELQDAASQAVTAFTSASSGMRILDFCAGGGGKSLALAALTRNKLVAHDANPARLRALPARAERAGARITIDLDPPMEAFDLVFADAPCSGSGAWRRDPEGKWRLSSERLMSLNALQDEVLASAARRVAPGGQLAYATCSLLESENAARVARFLEVSAGTWSLTRSRHFLPTEGPDGFFIAMMARN